MGCGFSEIRLLTRRKKDRRCERRMGVRDEEANVMHVIEMLSNQYRGAILMCLSELLSQTKHLPQSTLRNTEENQEVNALNRFTILESVVFPLTIRFLCETLRSLRFNCRF